MARRNCGADEKQMSDDFLSSAMSSSTLEIVLDEQSGSDSGDEDYNGPSSRSKAGTTGNGHSTNRRKRTIAVPDPKSHRLIEKRRRDRMNACLGDLLQLIPHQNPDGQRRIEKTEIIEMAIIHMRHLISTADKRFKKTENSNIDSYQTGYRNGFSDISEIVNEYSDGDNQLIIEIKKIFTEKEIELNNLTVVPDKKQPTKVLILSDKNKKLSSSLSKQEKHSKHDLADTDQICVISEVEEYKHEDPQSSIEQQPNLTQQSDPNVKVPIFVLHPSGTHYLPMCIDASVVSHAFKKNSNLSRTSSTTDQVQCHPVSIPVNFNPLTAISDPYELDIQNINVIGSRHQTSVRPN